MHFFNGIIYSFITCCIFILIGVAFPALGSMVIFGLVYAYVLYVDKFNGEIGAPKPPDPYNNYLHKNDKRIFTLGMLAGVIIALISYDYILRLVLKS